MAEQQEHILAPTAEFDINGLPKPPKGSSLVDTAEFLQGMSLFNVVKMEQDS